MEVHPHDETVPSTRVESTAENEAFVGDFLPVSPASSNFVCACMYVHSKTIKVRLVYIIIYVGYHLYSFNIVVAVEQLIPLFPSYRTCNRT
jgi:hypothetical protein